MSNAIATNPSAVNNIFSTATTGIGAVVQSLVDTETDSTTGLITYDEQGINQAVTNLTTQEAQESTQLSQYESMLSSNSHRWKPR